MTCQQVQTNLSLYLYGELDFAPEEALEQHLESCAFCQRVLARKKEWHGALNAERADVPLELLAECRRDLSFALGARHAAEAESAWWSWMQSSGFGATRWSLRVAAASFLVFLGFGAGRWMDGSRGPFDGVTEAGFLNPPTTRVRDIQPQGKDGVRLVIDQVREQAVTGRVGDGQIRRLLLAAMEDPTDPGIRVYSVEVLKGQSGGDVRDALLKSAKHDPNAAVRLKALDGLRSFSDDPSTVETLKYVLEHDGDAGVRSEAIDVLAPADGSLPLTRRRAGTFEDILRSEREDDYVRTRCLQILREVNAPSNVY